MKLIDTIKALPRERRSATVEEWADGDEACVLYALPLSVSDMKWIQARHKNFITEFQIEGMVDLIIRKCEDEAGEKVFTKEDKQTVMHRASLDVIGDIFGELWGTKGDFGEDAEKN